MIMTMFDYAVIAHIEAIMSIASINELSLYNPCYYINVGTTSPMMTTCARSFVCYTLRFDENVAIFTCLIGLAYIDKYWQWHAFWITV